MAQITLGGTPTTTSGDLPSNDSQAPAFELTKSDLSQASLSDFEGKNVILNIFPSIDTGVCATSVRTFNQKASGLENTVVLCISRDLPFAHARFCGAEGIEDVETLSTFRTNGEFEKSYGTLIMDGAFAGLNARAVVVLNTSHKVVYSELVPEVGQEPNYENAIAALS